MIRHNTNAGPATSPKTRPQLPRVACPLSRPCCRISRDGNACRARLPFGNIPAGASVPRASQTVEIVPTTACTGCRKAKGRAWEARVALVGGGHVVHGGCCAMLAVRILRFSDAFRRRLRNLILATATGLPPRSCRAQRDLRPLPRCRVSLGREFEIKELRLSCHRWHNSHKHRPLAKSRSVSTCFFRIYECR